MCLLEIKNNVYLLELSFVASQLELYWVVIPTEVGILLSIASTCSFSENKGIDILGKIPVYTGMTRLCGRIFLFLSLAAGSVDPGVKRKVPEPKRFGF